MISKPSVVWYPASSRNYTSAHRESDYNITKIIIHVTQGSWSSAVNWFQNPDAGVSAHYVVRSSDGKIAQSVSDINIAYHAGYWEYNKHSIGIEHEGYIDNKSWFTREMYGRSAKLTAYLCRHYRIPIDRKHIIGHYEVPGCPGPGGGSGCHTDPGKYWNWRYYMRHVRYFAHL
jgi:N-acetyl-anhydromuramyl-L-alanine amidase AmpD